MDIRIRTEEIAVRVFVNIAANIREARLNTAATAVRVT
jgi:hypothetical protein